MAFPQYKLVVRQTTSNPPPPQLRNAVPYPLAMHYSTFPCDTFTSSIVCVPGGVVLGACS